VTAKPAAERTAAEAVPAPRADAPSLPAAEPAPLAARIDGTVRQIAARHSLPPELLHSVIQVESNYNPLAVSNKGAQGLMQLIPSTARRFGVSDVFDPVDNITGGARYLQYLLDLYHNDYALALAAYNAGEGAVARYGGIPPYPETRNYVESVARRLKGKQPAAADPKNAEQKPAAAEAKAAGPNHIQEIVEPDGSVRYVSR
jgi:soluble lytic murein transglycosylase-like protein